MSVSPSLSMSVITPDSLTSLGRRRVPPSVSPSRMPARHGWKLRPEGDRLGGSWRWVVIGCGNPTAECLRSSGPSSSLKRFASLTAEKKRSKDRLAIGLPPAGWLRPAVVEEVAQRPSRDPRSLQSAGCAPRWLRRSHSDRLETPQPRLGGLACGNPMPSVCASQKDGLAIGLPPVGWLRISRWLRRSRSDRLETPQPPLGLPIARKQRLECPLSVHSRGPGIPCPQGIPASAECRWPVLE